MDLQEWARSFRGKLISLEVKASKEMASTFLDVRRRLELEVRQMLVRASERRKAGESVSLAWLERTERLDALRVMVLSELSFWGVHAASSIGRLQREAVDLARDEVERFFFLQQERVGSSLAVGIEWNRVPLEAMEHLVGQLADGSPLEAYFKALPRRSWMELKGTLAHGLAAGWNPRKVGKAISGVFDGTRHSALLTARTSMMNASREASIMAYEENPKIVKGWIWWSALDDRTCPICWARHGSHHTGGMFSHLACRCVPIPDTVHVEVRVTPGEEEFLQLSKDRQERILGPGAFALFEQGEISLGDLVVETYDKRFGRGLRRRALKELGQVEEMAG